MAFMKTLDRRNLIKTAGSLAILVGISPAPLFARPLGFSEAEFYADADASIQQVPQVRFGEARA